jgi:hypothetical protein
MPVDVAQRIADLRLGLRACDQLLRETRRNDVTSADWTFEELVALRTDLAAQVVAAELGLDPRFVRPAGS